MKNTAPAFHFVTQHFKFPFTLQIMIYLFTCTCLHFLLLIAFCLYAFVAYFQGSLYRLISCCMPCCSFKMRFTDCIFVYTLLRTGLLQKSHR